MSTFTGLNTMVRGIFGAQTALNTTGHNITNAATPGYSRQSTNPAATNAEHRGGIYGAVEVGTGVEIQSIERSRDIFADKQFRNATSNQKYYETRAKAYDNLEVIFNDSGETGLANAISNFYKSWVDLSTDASNTTLRENTAQFAQTLCENMQTVAGELQKQINTTYNDIDLYLNDFNQILQDITDTNRQIIAAEADGSTANDLRDRRDTLTDQLAEYVNINVAENSVGAYQITSDGIMLVDGVNRLHFALSSGRGSASYGVDYGVIDYNIYIKESKQIFVPKNGMFKADLDIIDECKSYIDKLADMATFMLTTFNDQHKQGYDVNGNVGKNFFGNENINYEYSFDTDTNVYGVTTLNSKGEIIDLVTQSVVKRSDYTQLTGIQIINACNVNAKLLDMENAGYNLVAAATRYAVNDPENAGNLIRYTVDQKLENYSDLELDGYARLNSSKLADYELTFGTDINSETSAYQITCVGPGDGTNAVYISELFNKSYSEIVEAGRSNALVMKDTMNYIKEVYGGNEGLYNEIAIKLNSFAGVHINDFYTISMTDLAINARVMDNNVEQQSNIMTQIQNWRDSVSGVDWNEELTNMIKFQKAYASCARCLTAMDECLEKLLSTGLVGR